MKFAVVKSPSSYNALLGRTRMRSLGAIAFTIHSMIKFPTSNRIATIAATRENLRECRQIKEAQALSRHARVTDPSLVPTSLKVTNFRVLLAPMETRSRSEHDGYPSAITEHSLHTYLHIEPKVQKKRSLAPYRRNVDKEGRIEDGFLYGIGRLLLHEDAFRSQECEGDISKAGRICLQGADRGKSRSICG
nr:reverse transcriptase domain-containing protein [Tanacetum cinerariifolium]